MRRKSLQHFFFFLFFVRYSLFAFCFLKLHDGGFYRPQKFSGCVFEKFLNSLVPGLAAKLGKSRGAAGARAGRSGEETFREVRVQSFSNAKNQ